MTRHLTILILSFYTFGCTFSSKSRASHDLPTRIAHAMGGIDNLTYSNSLEAWEHNYKKGCKYFEADLWITSDGRLVAFHDGLENDYGLSTGFTHTDFINSKFRNKYTPIDDDLLIELFLSNNDWILVTDVKNDQIKALKILCERLSENNVDCRSRIVPQIYDFPKGFQNIKSLGFERVILTLYRINDVTDSAVIKFVKSEPSIVAVTMPKHRANRQFLHHLNQLGKRTYVHTINGEDQINDVLSTGVYGVYTDFNCSASD